MADTEGTAARGDAALRFPSRLTKGDLVRVFVHHRLFGRWVIWVVPPLFAALAVPLNPRWYGNALGAVAIFAAISISMWLAMVMLSTLLYALTIWRLPADSPALDDAEVEVSDAGVAFLGRGHETRLAWESITEIKETRHFLGVRFRGPSGTLYLIPRRFVPEGGLASFRRRFDETRARTPPRKDV